MCFHNITCTEEGKNALAKNDKESNQKLKEKQAVLLDKRIIALDSMKSQLEQRLLAI